MRGCRRTGFYIRVKGGNYSGSSNRPVRGADGADVANRVAAEEKLGEGQKRSTSLFGEVREVYRSAKENAR